MTTAARSPLSVEQDTTEIPWWAGGNLLTNLSGMLLGAHIAHSALSLSWAGGMTLVELSRYNPSLPMYELARGL